MSSDVLEAKILIAIAAADASKGVLVTGLRRRFTNARRKRASGLEFDAAIEKLVCLGSAVHVARRANAIGIRLTEAGLRSALHTDFAAGSIARGRYTGKQLHEAQAALRLELARLNGAIRQHEHGLPAAHANAAASGAPAASHGGKTAASTPGVSMTERVRAAARAYEETKNPSGRLIPVHELRDAVPSTRLAFDDAIWSLARSGAGTLHKLNDEARMSEAGRQGAFRHPFTASLLYYFRLPNNRQP